MPGLKQDAQRKSVSVVLPVEVRQLLESMAQERTAENGTVYASDIVREAIEEYLRKRGHDISVEVDRGGFRG